MKRQRVDWYGVMVFLIICVPMLIGALIGVLTYTPPPTHHHHVHRVLCVVRHQEVRSCTSES